jgi:hypothetical protein
MPMTGEGGATGRAEVVHPLLAELRQAEAHSARMAAALHAGKKKGRATRLGTSSAPDRPGVLRAVK